MQLHSFWELGTLSGLIDRYEAANLGPVYWMIYGIHSFDVYVMKDPEVFL